MAEIKLIKDYTLGDNSKTYKKGDILKFSKEECKMFVNQGFAKWVEEPDKKKKTPFKTKQGIHITKKEYDRLKEKYSDNEFEMIDKKVRAWCDYYNKKPFKSKTKNVFLDRWKEEVTLINPTKDVEKTNKETKEPKISKEDLKKQKKQEEKSRLRIDFIELTTGKNTDWGEATEILVNYIKKNYYIYTIKRDKENESWVYKNGIYVPDAKSEVKYILRDILKDRYTIYVYNLVMAKLEPDTYIDEKEFFMDKNIDEIPVKNGILNVITKELKPFTPNKIFFNKINAVWDRRSTCPKIEKFFKQVIKHEEDTTLMYEIIGYCLLKEYRFEKAFMFLGDGRNGKDKTLELIKRLVSPENSCSVDLHRLEKDTWGLHELFGKLVNLAGELSSESLKNVQNFKAATGRSTIAGRRKFKETIDFVNYAKFIFACNQLPMVSENTKAFWDRWVLLEFPYTFVKKEEYEQAEDKTKLKIRDENIINKIASEEELSGLLTKSLEGLERLMKNKEFSRTKGSEEIKDFWMKKANSFMAFCLDKIEEDPEEYITKKEIRREYKKYCKKHRIRSGSDKMIKITLQNEFGVVEERKTIYENSNELNGKQVFVWDGIKWKK